MSPQQPPPDQPVLAKRKASSVLSSIDSDTLSKKDGSDVKTIQVRADDLCDAEPATFSFTNFLFRRSTYKPVDLDAVSTRRSVYDDPKLAQYYWPKPEYENLHRFDPNARWTFREERALVRKIDWRVMLWAAISFSALNLDRGNLSHANTDNFLPDLGMDTNDFNLGNSIFRLAFLSAELPSQLVSKKLGPDVWIPIQMCIWSIITIGQFWLSGRTSFLVCRALLGFCQGGFIPDLVLYLSYFYTKFELPFRLALFWLSADVCGILASFLSYGVLHMRGILGRAGWRWLFLVEGCITLIIGLATFFMMPPSPTQTKTWFRPNGWFTEREETIATSRVLRDDPTKGDMHNREGLTVKRIWQALCDYDMWPLYIIGLTFSIPPAPVGQYLTLSLRELGFGTFTTNLLGIPATIGSMITMITITLISEAIHQRTLVAMSETVWILPFIIALYTLPDFPNPWVFYVLSLLLLMYPYSHAIQVAWCSRNSGAVAARTVSASLYNMFVQTSSIVSANIYRKDDAPRYRRGNRILMGVAAFNLVILYPGTRMYYIWRNKQRDKIWNAMTEDEKVNYLATTKDVGNRRLDFRFAY
ncbi:allantoate permease [Macrolepiota fuliginosa MF-IS2]|uniref:Allantoate permease n=1 Tax=Macrolepiota fuliginosa MF-IS2 TaxID=1400762 RepID=A0A9P6C6I0_9AGAR|nr:allantoate permease [Macrolepiota fuliginosa MF-IS2]